LHGVDRLGFRVPLECFGCCLLTQQPLIFAAD
jgi:hypothetical protein